MVSENGFTEKLTDRMSKRLLDSRVGRACLPRYRGVKDRSYRDSNRRSTVYAFHLKRSPNWIVIGKGWVGNMSDLDFVSSFDPSNAEARTMMDKALGRIDPKVVAIYKARRS